MLKYVRKEDVVVVTKLDRVARSTRDLLEIVDVLEAKGVAFQVLNINLDTSTATGKLMLSMLASIAEFERALMLERQAEGMAKAKAEGRIKGRPSTARDQAKKILELVSEGKIKQAIADELGVGIASMYRVMREAKEGRGV